MLLPLYVDLDGTLSRTDTLHEMTLLLLKKNLLYIFLLPVWLISGIATLKQEIASRVDFDVSTLPYDYRVLELIKSAKESGRRVILLTAADQSVADSVSIHLGLFESAIGSNGKENLKSERKLEVIQSQSPEGFEYIGNSSDDVVILREAAGGVLVSSDPRLVRNVVGQSQSNIGILDRSEGSMRPVIKTLRLHQWVKNVLVVTPIILDHRVDQVDMLFSGFIAFLSFSFCASAIYVFNDLLDVQDDRKHPSKRNRPIAAGQLGVAGAIRLASLLVVFSGVTASFLTTEFVMVLLLYAISSMAYSLRLKRVAILDVLVLASLFTTRILSGNAATGIELSFWLLAFSMFVFLSLALVKRYTELIGLDEKQLESMPGRGYRVGDLEFLPQIGATSAYMAVMVLALYINSPDVIEMYSRPEIIWLLCPLMLYLLTRVWLLARRQEIHDDPVVFILKDKRSLCMGGLALTILWLAA